MSFILRVLQDGGLTVQALHLPLQVRGDGVLRLHRPGQRHGPGLVRHTGEEVTHYPDTDITSSPRWTARAGWWTTPGGTVTRAAPGHVSLETLNIRHF